MNNKILWVVIAFVIVVFGVLAFSSSDEQEKVEPATADSLSLSDIHGLEVDISDPERLYLPNHQGLYVQHSDGSISKVSEISDDLMSFALSPTNQNLFFASGHPKTGGNLGLIRSDDGGVTWQNVSEGLNGPVDFHTMSVDSKNDDHIYGYYAGALQRSLDGGGSWEYLNNAPNQIIQISAGDKEGQIYAGTTNGLYLSDNQGDSWELFAFGGETVIAIEINPVSGQLIVNTSAQGLVTSEDSGETWSKSTFGTSDTVLYIASSVSKPEQAYLVTRSLKIYQSTDSGATWSLR
jgi:photosystem II stability/assembly factor-like uncharacterized protein